MKKTTLFLLSLAVTLLTSCMSEEEKITRAFVTHVKNFDLEAVKNICTADTKFYIRMGLEPMINLNEEVIEDIKKAAGSLKCTGEDTKRVCTYTDENGKRKSFELSIVENLDDSSEEQYLVDIDKNYFLGE